MPHEIDINITKAFRSQRTEAEHVQCTENKLELDKKFSFVRIRNGLNGLLDYLCWTRTIHSQNADGVCECVSLGLQTLAQVGNF